MKNLAQERLKRAADAGVLVVSPDESHAIHHEPANQSIELGFGHRLDAGLTKAAQTLYELMRPLTPDEDVKAGIVRHR